MRRWRPKGERQGWVSRPAGPEPVVLLLRRSISRKAHLLTSTGTGLRVAVRPRTEQRPVRAFTKAPRNVTGMGAALPANVPKAALAPFPFAPRVPPHAGHPRVLAGGCARRLFWRSHQAPGRSRQGPAQ